MQTFMKAAALTEDGESARNTAEMDTGATGDTSLLTCSQASTVETAGAESPNRMKLIRG